MLYMFKSAWSLLIFTTNIFVMNFYFWFCFKIRSLLTACLFVVFLFCFFNEFLKYNLVSWCLNCFFVYILLVCFAWTYFSFLFLFFNWLNMKICIWLSLILCYPVQSLCYWHCIWEQWSIFMISYTKQITLIYFCIQIMSSGSLKFYI